MMKEFYCTVLYDNCKINNGAYKVAMHFYNFNIFKLKSNTSKS